MKKRTITAIAGVSILAIAGITAVASSGSSSSDSSAESTTTTLADTTTTVPVVPVVEVNVVDLCKQIDDNGYALVEDYLANLPAATATTGGLPVTDSSVQATVVSAYQQALSDDVISAGDIELLYHALGLNPSLIIELVNPAFDVEAELAKLESDDAWRLTVCERVVTEASNAQVDPNAGVKTIMSADESEFNALVHTADMSSVYWACGLSVPESGLDVLQFARTSEEGAGEVITYAYERRQYVDFGPCPAGGVNVAEDQQPFEAKVVDNPDADELEVDLIDEDEAQEAEADTGGGDTTSEEDGNDTSGDGTTGGGPDTTNAPGPNTSGPGSTGGGNTGTTTGPGGAGGQPGGGPAPCTGSGCPGPGPGGGGGEPAPCTTNCPGTGTTTTVAPPCTTCGTTTTAPPTTAPPTTQPPTTAPPTTAPPTTVPPTTQPPTTTTQPPTTTTTQPPVDVCPNLPGIQPTLPPGYRFDPDGNCKVPDPGWG